MRDLIRRRLPWQPAWAQDGRRPNAPLTRWPLWLRRLRGVSGIYFFRDKMSKQLLYVGRAVDLHDRVRRHCNAWNEAAYGRPHQHATYDRQTIEVRIYVAAIEHCAELEARYIAKLTPRDNVRAEAVVLSREPGEDDEDVPMEPPQDAPELW